MKEVLQIISENWKLDAKLEDSSKYFFNYKEVDEILNKNKCYVIGRKGSGKSAICEHIVRNTDYRTFAKKLSFKNYPFNELYELSNNSYTRPNQYITLWKYLIYSTICQLMVSNEHINSEFRRSLEDLYPQTKKSLPRMISTWTKAGFGASILGNGGNISLERNVVTNDLSWIDKVDLLEDLILTNCDDSVYYIVFDELDEDYRDEGMNSSESYVSLLTSLFKAVQDVKSVFLESQIHVNPIVFLRDDIYSLIKDSDKNKWRDMKVELEWSEEKLKALLAFRISQDLELGKLLSFDDAWYRIFSRKPVRYGNKQIKTTDSFSFIAKKTLLRPRDFIQYIQACAEAATSQNSGKIGVRNIIFVDRAFSNYFKDEIVDEIFPILPEIEDIICLISNIRKWNFSYKEFECAYRKALNNAEIKEKNIDFVLSTLYNFSVIGNQHKHNKKVLFFKYQHTNMTFNKEENIVIHRGLFKAFHLN